jgi:hypothetical protein
MIRLSKSVLAVGAVVLAGSLITLMNPKTVHAVAAALVQVTNTASNPVVTQSTGNQAAQIVHLVCNLDNSTNNQNCTLDPPQSALSNGGPPYVVPDNESLVITAVDILPAEVFVPGCNFNHTVYLSLGVGYSQEWVVNNASLHFAYPSGIVVPSGFEVQATTVEYFGPTTATAACNLGPDQVDLRGYLTAS